MWGRSFARPAPRKGVAWRHATYSRAVLDVAAEALLDGEPVPLPRSKDSLSIPLVTVNELGRLGYDRRDITDTFEVVSTSQGYPALWGQNADEVDRMHFQANAELAVRTSRPMARSRGSMRSSCPASK